MVDSANKECVSENGILQQEEFARYKARSVDTKFKQQLFLGVGGAFVFGVAAAIGKGLFDLALAGGAMATTAGVGLAVLGVVGVICIYMGSKYLSKSILLDQDFQAKKIGAAARGVNVTPTLEPAQAQEKGGNVVPIGMANEANMQTPATNVTGIVAQDRVVSPPAADRTTPDTGFADRVLATANASEVAVPTI